MSLKNLADEQHDQNVKTHTDLWLYIIEKYKNEPSRAIVGLGDLVASPLIELSSWGFPTFYVNFGYDTIEESKKMAEKFAGEFQRYYNIDYFKDCPRGAVITFIGIVEYLNERDMFRWLDLLLRRSVEIVFAVPIDRDWNRLLSGRYDTLINKYRNSNYYLISLTKKYDQSKKFRREVEERRKDTKANSKTQVLREK